MTALLNGEIQIAQFVPPHMVRARARARRTRRSSPRTRIEIMFLAMQPKAKPFDNKLVRQAVAYAIDRDAIIQGVLQGQARAAGRARSAPASTATTRTCSPSTPTTPRRPSSSWPRPATRTASTWSCRRRSAATRRTSRSPRRWPPDADGGGHPHRLLTPEWPTLWADVQDGQGAVLLHGPRLGARPGPRAVPVLRDRRLAAHRLLESAARRAVRARSAAPFDPSRAQAGRSPS